MMKAGTRVTLIIANSEGVGPPKLSHGTVIKQRLFNNSLEVAWDNWKDGHNGTSNDFDIMNRWYVPTKSVVVWTKKNEPKKYEDMDCEDFGKYCPLKGKTTVQVNGGTYLCDGRYCESAYEKYLEQFGKGEVNDR